MTNEWQTDLEDWEYVKAFQDGWEVEVLAKRFPDHEESWQAIEGRLDLFDCLRSKNNKYRTRKPAPEKSEAEKFLEKWKGQKVTRDLFNGSDYDWVIVEELCVDDTFFTGRDSRGGRTKWDRLADWHPYTEPEELEALPEELTLLTSYSGNLTSMIVDTINFLLREAKRQREDRDE